MDRSSFGTPQHVSFCLRKQTFTFDVTCRFYGNVLSWKNINQMHTESAQDISADVQRIDIFYFTNKSKAFSATFKTFLLVYIQMLSKFIKSNYANNLFKTKMINNS